MLSYMAIDNLQCAILLDDLTNDKSIHGLMVMSATVKHFSFLSAKWCSLLIYVNSDNENLHSIVVLL